MNDLLIKSFKAQARWLSTRMENKEQRRQFGWIVDYLIRNSGKFRHVPTTVQQLALDIWRETEKNLTARFETGVPLESWSIDE